MTKELSMPPAVSDPRMLPAGRFCLTALWSRRTAHERRERDTLAVRTHDGALRNEALGVALSVIVGLNGCHFPQLLDRPSAFFDNSRFMDAWQTYLHCRSTMDLAEVRDDLQQLKRVTDIHARSMQDRTYALLPTAIKSVIAAPPSRLAVDPHAMVAACALHGAHVAQAAGQPGMSLVLLTAVAAAREGAANPYYAVEAQHRLNGMEW
ncbi:MAG: hypothetical protein KIT40_15970 [Nitrospira sp.]|nr:hypothetical protein [Nitrospira sp.]